MEGVEVTKGCSFCEVSKNVREEGRGGKGGKCKLRVREVREGGKEETALPLYPRTREVRFGGKTSSLKEATLR